MGLPMKVVAQWDEGKCWKAAAFEHWEILKYAHENSCPWDWSKHAGVAEQGHMELLGYAYMGAAERILTKTMVVVALGSPSVHKSNNTEILNM